VEITSLGVRTDLALLRLGGSTVEDRGDHLVIRSPHNPTFWWGNFLLLPGPPPPERTDHWLGVFAAAFPEAQHVAIGFDGVHGTPADAAGFVERGLRVETSAVMTATAVHEPPRPNRDADYRQLGSDGDWDQLVDLRMAAMAAAHDAEGYRTFTLAKVATIRARSPRPATAAGSARSRTAGWSRGWGCSGPATVSPGSRTSRPGPRPVDAVSPARWCTT
jgi:hypothetical protein